MSTLTQTQFFEDLQNELKAEGHALKWWQITEVNRESIQRLYQGDVRRYLVPHQNRWVDERSYAMSVHVPGKTEETLGQAQMDLDMNVPIAEQIAVIISMAQQADNKAWMPVSPPKEDYPEVQTADPLILEDMEGVMSSLEQDAISAIQNLNDIKVTTAELYVRKAQVKRVSSTGIATSKDVSDVYFEIAMEQTPDHKNQEVNNVTTSVSSTDINIKEFIEKTAVETASLGLTEEPVTTESAVILVDDDAISSFTLALCSQLNCANEFYQFPFLKEGHDFQAEGDSLTLTLDPFVPAMVDSSPYTGEGLLARKETVIDEGKVTTQIVGNRFGQYLNKTPNAIAGNMVVSLGSHSKAELLAKHENVIEVIKFSSLLVDDQKLTWSSEIKLAKQYHADGTITLLKGGVVSGHVGDNLKQCLFSKEEGRVNFPGTGFYEGKGYVGPKYMLIASGVSIVGQAKEVQS